jgi:disulfide bond formation protein DsbB
MTLTRNSLIFLAAAGSLAILLTGFGFQYLGGLRPCELCLWQRWPHAIAPVIGMGAIALGGRMLPLAGAVTMAVSTGLGLYHTGVERHWWNGPARCTGDGAGLAGLTPEQMLNPAMIKPIVLCDQVSWEMFGLSMASYNALASLALLAFWIWALRLSRR